MSNMSYCRFQNTLSDLRECYYAIEGKEELSVEESQARDQMLVICREIVELLDEEENDSGK